MQAFINLFDAVFTLYLVVCILRFWLQLAKADFYNPISQFVVKVTNPIVVPLRKVIPSIGKVDTAGLVLILLVAFAEVVTIQYLAYGAIYTTQLITDTLLTILSTFLNVLFGVMIIRAVLSWISQGYNPVEAVLFQLSEPFLAPVRKVIPPVGGLDLSMLVFFLVLMFLTDLVKGFF